MDWQTSVMGAIATLFVTCTLAATAIFKDVLSELGKKWVKRIQVSNTRFSNGLSAVGAFYHICEQLKELEFVDRVTFYEGKNGGGIPQAGKSFTIHSTFWWGRDKGSWHVDTYDARFEIDSHYITLLLDLMRRGGVELNVNELPEGSILRSFFVREKVVSSRMYYLTLNPETATLSYMSLSNSTRAFTADETAQIDLLVSQIRVILEKGG